MCIGIKHNCFIKVIKHKLVIVAVTNFIGNDPLIIQIQNGTQIQLADSEPT